MKEEKRNNYAALALIVLLAATAIAGYRLAARENEAQKEKMKTVEVFSGGYKAVPAAKQNDTFYELFG